MSLGVQKAQVRYHHPSSTFCHSFLCRSPNPHIPPLPCQGQQTCHPHSMFCGLSAPHRPLGGSKLLSLTHLPGRAAKYLECRKSWFCHGFTTPISQFDASSQLRSCTSAQVDCVTNYNSCPRRPNDRDSYFIGWHKTRGPGIPGFQFWTTL